MVGYEVVITDEELGQLTRERDQLVRERDQLGHERDLYLRLLELARHDDVTPLLIQSLARIVASADAVRGYIELGPPGDGDHPPRWWTAEGFADHELSQVRRQISSRIIAQALVTGEIIETVCAMQDDRFRDSESVQNNDIRAVLCAPVGRGRSLGVLYLQGGLGGAPFTESARRSAAVFAEHLGPMVDRVITRRAAVIAADPTEPFRHKLAAPDLIGRSPAFARVLAGVCVAAPLDVTVLLTGPTGTGKTRLARAIHAAGPRHAAPFLELNCAAIPDTLLESELFGAEQGGHSTATRRIEGKVGAATGGTLFLDEIGELSATAQSKLLQLLDTRRYYPLGASRPRDADVRIIVATHVNLQQAVSAGQFREDLFYRIQVLRIAVPAVGERREDLPALARHFGELACDRHRFPRLELTPAAIAAIEEEEWPGNLRQLAHVIETGAIWAASERSPRIELRHLFPERVAQHGDDAALTWQEATRRYQRQLLRQVLDQEEWNVVRAAGRLDLTRSHIYNLIQALGLRRDEP